MGESRATKPGLKSDKARISKRGSRYENRRTLKIPKLSIILKREISHQDGKQKTCVSRGAGNKRVEIEIRKMSSREKNTCEKTRRRRKLAEVGTAKMNKCCNVARNIGIRCYLVKAHQKPESNEKGGHFV